MSQPDWESTKSDGYNALCSNIRFEVWARGKLKIDADDERFMGKWKLEIVDEFRKLFFLQKLLTSFLRDCFGTGGISRMS